MTDDQSELSAGTKLEKSSSQVYGPPRIFTLGTMMLQAPQQSRSYQWVANEIKRQNAVGLFYTNRIVQFHKWLELY